ncbi:MAG: hypothetical protein BGO29_04510 [Bacteroidales bacterium 36-12]|nr:MAG: hypothetical protein BGO29_04510 [Bacteroidales bacterium 36-12]
MILSFCEDRFVELILKKEKLYTLRKSDRIKPGQILQLWKHNPRNVTKNPYQFGTAICPVVDKMELIPDDNKVIHLSSTKEEHNQRYEIKDVEHFAHGDGFASWQEMKKFFPKRCIIYRIWLSNVKPTLQFYYTVYDNKQGMGYILPPDININDYIVREPVMIAGEIIHPDSLTSLNNYFIRSCTYIGLNKMNISEMIFYLGMDEYDLFPLKYYASVLRVNENRIFEMFSNKAGRDFNFVNGNWK